MRQSFKARQGSDNPVVKLTPSILLTTHLHLLQQVANPVWGCSQGVGCNSVWGQVFLAPQRCITL